MQLMCMRIHNCYKIKAFCYQSQIYFDLNKLINIKQPADFNYTKYY